MAHPVKVLSNLLTLLAEGPPVALATVVATAGSTPRHPGARMVVAADGTSWGTIGGG
ncbi:MAG: XdhC family protein, partial [Myxococcales bacterium]|nr:XdhC family protein [Myxococcales bacterium]